MNYTDLKACVVELSGNPAEVSLLLIQGQRHAF